MLSSDFLINNSNQVILSEMYYKEMVGNFNPANLPHKDYLHLVHSVKYDGYKNGTMRFFVPNKYNGWQTYIKMVEWNEVVNDLDYNAVEASRLLLWGANIKVFCSCPSFLFWGYNYILTQKDAAIIPEHRFPSIRNPNLKGICCKHLRKSLIAFPFHVGDIARAVKEERQSSLKR